MTEEAGSVEYIPPIIEQELRMLNQLNDSNPYAYDFDLDFKKLDQVSQRTTDLISGYIRELTKDAFVPDLIRMTCILFFYQMQKCHIFNLHDYNDNQTNNNYLYNKQDVYQLTAQINKQAIWQSQNNKEIILSIIQTITNELNWKKIDSHPNSPMNMISFKYCKQRINCWAKINGCVTIRVQPKEQSFKNIKSPLIKRSRKHLKETHELLSYILYILYYI